DKVIRTNLQYILFVGYCLLTAIFFSRCDITSSLQSNEHLLVSNKISFTEKIKNQDEIKEKLSALEVQKPNTKMFGLVPFRLSIYNTTYNKRETKFR
ncbi:MAG: hypothetical protein KDC82_05850, partial [Bacteroidetes bacterium]|nr:hypothetical protein [Bacteroidota bacterium]